jgi:hypothetical protein
MGSVRSEETLASFSRTSPDQVCMNTWGHIPRHAHCLKDTDIERQSQNRGRGWSHFISQERSIKDEDRHIIEIWTGVTINDGHVRQLNTIASGLVTITCHYHLSFQLSLRVFIIVWKRKHTHTHTHIHKAELAENSRKELRSKYVCMSIHIYIQSPPACLLVEFQEHVIGWRNMQTDAATPRISRESFFFFPVSRCIFGVTE